MALRVGILTSNLDGVCGITVRTWFAVLALAGLAVSCHGAQEVLRFDSLKRGQREIGLAVGYGENHRIPSAMKNRFAFDMLSFRSGRMTSPRTQIALEVGVGRHFKNADRVAVSAVFGYRRYFLVRGSMALGYDLAVGLIYMDGRVDELATKTNFTEQVGLVLQVGTGRNSAFTMSYRLCHVSNAGIKLPNIGLNASVLSVGSTYYR